MPFDDYSKKGFNFFQTADVGLMAILFIFSLPVILVILVILGPLWILGKIATTLFGDWL